MPFEENTCASCNHKVIAGVACDGHPGTCPLHPDTYIKHYQEPRFASASDEMTGLIEPDVVRGID